MAPRRAARNDIVTTALVFLMALSALYSPIWLGEQRPAVAQGSCPAGCVLDTLFLSNNTLYSGNVPIQPRIYAGVANWTFVPFDVVASPKDGRVYVSESTYPTKPSYALMEVEPDTMTVGRVLGSSSGSNLFSPYETGLSNRTGLIYVEGFPPLVAVNTTSNSTRLTYSTQSASVLSPIAVDSDDGLVYAYAGTSISDHFPLLVSVNDTSGAPSTNPIPLSSNSTESVVAMMYGQGMHQLYVVTVAHSGGGKVTSGALYVLNTTSSKVSGRVEVTGFPTGLTLDTWNGDLYVTNLNFSVGVTVVDPRALSVVAHIPGALSTGGIAFDAANGFLFEVAGYGTGGIYPVDNVTVIDGSTNKFIGNITVGYGATDIAYNSVDRDLFVTNLYSGTLSVISAPGFQSGNTTSSSKGTSTSSDTTRSSTASTTRLVTPSTITRTEVTSSPTSSTTSSSLTGYPSPTGGVSTLQVELIAAVAGVTILGGGFWLFRRGRLAS